MNILALCSALNYSYLAFEIDGKIYSEIIKSDDKNYHSLYLLPKINEFAQKNNFSLSKLDLITVNCGPGSFTGIRAALTIAKIMASELNLPIVPLNTSEILLDAFEKDIFVMDARRDMFFLGNKKNINLILKNNIEELCKDKSILCDKRSVDLFKNPTCFEDYETDLGKNMIKLAKLKYSNSTSKDEFEYHKIKANYIQTPPVF